MAFLAEYKARWIERERERERELHYVRLDIVNPIGTDGRSPAHMGWSQNRERKREREHNVCIVWMWCVRERERETENRGVRGSLMLL